MTYFSFAIGGTFLWSRGNLLLLFVITGLIILFSQKKIKFDRTLGLIIIYLTIIYILQTLFFGEGNLQAFVFLILVTIILPYMFLKIIGLKFIHYFVNVIYFFSILSLIFFILTNLSSEFYSLSSKFPQYLGLDKAADEQYLIYTYETQTVLGMIRNPGPVYEPGAWAVFVLLAICFNVLTNKKLFNIKNILFIITIITTFSTAGFLSLSILILYFLLFSKMNYILKWIVLPLALYFIIDSFLTYDFLFPKIEDQYSIQSNQRLSLATSGRFYGFRKAINSITTYPLIGRGIVVTSAVDVHSPLDYGYGLITAGAKFGMIALIFYLIYLVKSMKYLSQVFNIKNRFFYMFFATATILSLSSQTLFLSPIFLMIIYVHIIYAKKIIT